MSSGWERIRLRVETKEDIANLSSDGRTISSHVLDTTLGKAAAGIMVTIHRFENEEWQQLNQKSTDEDGRVAQLLSKEEFTTGNYKLRFDVGSYLKERHGSSFYPTIEIVVACVNREHYHVPLLLNPYGYTTYRGS